MNEEQSSYSLARAVPSARVSRFGHFDRLASGVAAAWHIPPAGVLFVQRKISLASLLAVRLKARIDPRAMLEIDLRG